MKLTPTLTNRNIPDSYGTNAYLSDPDFASLLGIYLDHEVMTLVEPRFVKLGGLVRGELEQLALTADRNPPILHLRARNSSDLQKIEKHPSYIALERYAFSEYGLAAMSHRGGVFGRDEKLPPAVRPAARPTPRLSWSPLPQAPALRRGWRGRGGKRCNQKCRAYLAGYAAPANMLTHAILPKDLVL